MNERNTVLFKKNLCTSSKTENKHEWNRQFIYAWMILQTNVFKQKQKKQFHMLTFDL